MDYYYKYKEYKHKYKKYKHRYNTCKKQKNKLFAFVVDEYSYDTILIIVSANSIQEAYEELDKLDPNGKFYEVHSAYALHYDINELKKFIFEKNISPKEINTPMVFDFYNG